MTDTDKTHNSIESSLAGGVDYILEFAKNLPDTPGVYRMLDHHENVLYVGKAKRLKRRVLNYTKIDRLPVRLQRMVSETVQLEVVNTHTEVEALLLESNLIKKLKPRYNILLRDDKSFPYLYLDTEHDFPRLDKFRGKRDGKGMYYGPFASTGAVNRTIATLQKAFLLRNCSDNDFATRSRPCLQYHIKRCSAPCVGHVSRDEYAQQTQDLQPFLEGKSTDVKEKLQEKMDNASDKQEYEKAAAYRDRITAISLIQSQQDINVEGVKDADVIACVVNDELNEKRQACVQIFFFRGGQNLGNKSYYPVHGIEDTEAAILKGFTTQFYLNKPVPSQVLLSHEIDEVSILEEALSSVSNHKVEILNPQRGKRKSIVEFAINNAVSALNRHMSTKVKHETTLKSLVDLFDLDDTPKRVEIYDNSHISGTNMVGGMVVFTPDGFQKSSYRKFNIKKAQASDDYGMMREVMERRFRNVRPEDEAFPDILLIDGGKGQLSVVHEVLSEMGVFNHLCVVAISKGPDRNAGREEFHIHGRKSISLPIDSSVLYALQNLRDEAHRFAVDSHKLRRHKKAIKSSLDEIDGIGPKKKKALLHYFGSVDAIKNAAINDIKNVDGISSKIAEKIYYSFHGDR